MKNTKKLVPEKLKGVEHSIPAKVIGELFKKNGRIDGIF